MKIINTKTTLALLITLCTLSVISVHPAYAAGPAQVNLLSARNFVILAKSGISTTGTTMIVGDIGISPAAATFITGFALHLLAESPFSTSPLVIGKVFTPNYSSPTPTNITTAVLDMETAYTNGSGRTNPDVTELGAGNISGMTIAPGLYKWSTGVTIPTDVILSGGANDVWIFQIAQNLNLSSFAKIILRGGAQADNVYWIVAGQATVGTNALVNGNILSKTAIVLNTGAVLHGRALAQTAVTLDSNAVTIPFSNSSSVSLPSTPVFPIVSQTVSLTPTISNTQANTSNTSLHVKDAGCLGGNTISTTTGYACPVYTSTINAEFLNQQIKKISTTLTKGNTSTSVKILQEFLIAQNSGKASTALATYGANAHFGPLTRSALAEFQNKVGIYPSLGNFGPLTRAYIQSH